MRLMTELEAVKKVCQESMSCDEQCTCIADHCMAWVRVGSRGEQKGYCLLLDRGGEGS